MKSEPLPRSQGWEEWACPRKLAQHRTRYSASTIPDLKVRKGGLPPQPCPKDYLNTLQAPPRSQGWEGWLAPAASPNIAFNTLQGPHMISRLGKGGLPPQPRPTAHSILRKRLPRSLGWEAWLAPATLPKSFLNTLQVPLSNLRPGDTYTVQKDSWATQRGQATLPNLEIGRVSSRVLGNLLGNSAGASHPF